VRALYGAALFLALSVTAQAQGAVEPAPGTLTVEMRDGQPYYVLDQARLDHWMREIDLGRKARGELPLVMDERDRWAEFSDYQAKQLEEERGWRADVTASRDRLRKEIEESDRKEARRPWVKRITVGLSLVAGFELGRRLN